MAKAETITIAFPNGGLLPTSVTGEKTERSVPAHQGVEVPRSYGLHLISDRFAYEVKVPARRKAAAKPSADLVAIVELEKTIAQLREQAEKVVTAEDQAKIADDLAAAEKLLAEIK